MFGGAGLAGYFTLFFLSFALAYLLDNWMPLELGALIVALLWGIAAAVLAAARPQGDQAGQPPASRHAADHQGGRPMGQNSEELTTTPARHRGHPCQPVARHRRADRQGQPAARRRAAHGGGQGPLGSVRDKLIGAADARGAASSGGSSVCGRRPAALGHGRRLRRGRRRRLQGRRATRSRRAGGVRRRHAHLGADPRQREGGSRPPSRRSEAAKEHGQPVIDEAKSVGQQIGQDLKSRRRTPPSRSRRPPRTPRRPSRSEGQDSANGQGPGEPGQGSGQPRL